MRSHFQFLLCLAGLCGVAQAQTPTIASLNPPSVPVGSGQFTLMVLGTNFQGGCYATWNNKVLVSNFVSSTEIDATVPASFLTLVETVYIGVSCPGQMPSMLVAFNVTGSGSLTISTPATLPQATAGTFYIASLQASGGTPPYQWSAQASIPQGLTLTSGGVLSGTPILAGQYAFPIQVTDSNSNTASQIFSLTISTPGGGGGSLTITTSSPLPAATAGTSYSATLAASGGTLPYRWSPLTVLPAGLTLSQGGVLSGTPTTANQYAFTIQVTDSSSSPLTASATFSLTVASQGGGGGTLMITTTSPLPAATAGSSYSATLAASGGTLPYRWSPLTVLPAGLTLSQGGVLSGTPTTANQYAFTIQVTDSSSPQNTAQQTLSLNVGSQGSGGGCGGGGTLMITTSSLPSATTGQTYTTTLGASGGTGTCTWLGTSLPSWLTLFAATGVLTGTPPTVGTFTIAVQVSDSASHTSSRGFSLVVTAGSSSLTVTTGTTLPQGTIGTLYNMSLAASGGTQPYFWSALTVLPAGLTLSQGGVLSGTPSTAAQYAFTVQVSDSSSPQNTAQQTFSLTVTGAGGSTLTITTSSLPAGGAGLAYTATLTASGGTPPYNWLGTSLPSWLILDPAAGTLSGTPPTVGTYTVAVQVTDSTSPSAQTASRSFSLSIAASSFTIATASPLPAGVVGVAYSATLSTTGGVAPYNWVILSGNTDGLNLDQNAGTLAGTPLTAGTFSFTVQVADSSGSGQMPSKAFSLTVTATAVTPLTVTTSSLPAAAAGQAYTATLAASGGTQPYTWLGTSLPPWLTLTASTGALSGTPPASGTFTVQVQVTDSTSPTPRTASRSFTLTVSAPSLTISTTSPLPAGTVGVAYPSTTLAVSGGTAPYTWVILSGNTDGLSLDPTGILSGTPTAAGTFNFTVQVTDNTPNTPLQGMKAFAVTIAAPSLTITTVGSSSGTVGGAFSKNFTVTGGTPPYTWTGTSLPSWLTLNPTTPTSGPATLAGMPTQPGSFSVTLKATDATQATGTGTFTITIAPGQLKITTATQLTPATLGTPYTFTMVAAGGTQPYTWSATGLPSGLTISAAGLISGTMGAAGALTFVVKVTDSAQPAATAQDNFHINVTPPALPAVTISGLPGTAAPLMQYTVTIAVASAYPVDITGTAILSSSPADSGPTDGSIQFSGGGKSASFKVTAGATSATLAIQTGSVAGTITLTLSQLSAGGMDVTPTPAPSAKTQMAAAAPVVTATSVSRSGSTLTVQITGYASSREITQAVFTFTAASGQTLQTSQFTIPLSALFATYYQNSQNASFGSQFVFAQPFTIQGDINSVIPQNVTLTNRVGSTTSAVSK
jgi:hypothetical protein